MKLRICMGTEITAEGLESQTELSAVDMSLLINIRRIDSFHVDIIVEREHASQDQSTQKPSKNEALLIDQTPGVCSLQTQ